MNWKRAGAAVATIGLTTASAVAFGASPAAAYPCGGSGLINATNQVSTTLKNPNNNIRGGPAVGCDGFGKPRGTAVTVYCYVFNYTPGESYGQWYFVTGRTPSYFYGWTIYKNLNGVNNTAC